jgi:hypothetical protein
MKRSGEEKALAEETEGKPSGPPQGLPPFIPRAERTEPKVLARNSRPLDS